MSNDFYSGVYNPDVLSCLANLSNDEVFTPPEIVNRMLDMLPEELFSNPSITFLDPSCKSGVFLREIAKRLMNICNIACTSPNSAEVTKIPRMAAEAQRIRKVLFNFA